VLRTSWKLRSDSHLCHTHSTHGGHFSVLQKQHLVSARALFDTLHTVVGTVHGSFHLNTAFVCQAVNMIGESPWSLEAAFMTQATVPSPPKLLTCTANRADTVLVSWQAPLDGGAPICAYQVHRGDGMEGDFQPMYNGSDCQYQATGLLSGLEYRFRVRAENEVGPPRTHPYSKNPEKINCCCLVLKPAFASVTKQTCSVIENSIFGLLKQLNLDGNLA